MEIDKDEVLKKAEALLNENKPVIEDDEGKKGSYDDENVESEEKSSENEEPLERDEVKDSNKFVLPEFGYKRIIHYKKPALWKFILGIVVIMFLGIIIGLLLPYIPMKVG